MVSTGELLVVVVFVIILIAFIIYLVVAHDNRWWPFNPYQHPPPDDSDRVFQPINSITELTPQEQKCNQWIVCQPPFATSGRPAFCDKEPFANVLQGPCPCSDTVCNANSSGNGTNCS